MSLHLKPYRGEPTMMTILHPRGTYLTMRSGQTLVSEAETMINYCRYVLGHMDPPQLRLRPHSLQACLDRFKLRVAIRRNLARLAHKSRMKRLAPELAAAAWSPHRVAAWLEAGMELEDM